MKPTKNNHNRSLALAALCGLALAQTASAQDIYYDDFSGSTASTLVGTAPDTRPGTQTWGGDTAAVTAGGTFGGQHGNALLSFTPQSGNIYELSAVITTNTTQPVYFGFQQRNWGGPLWEVQDIVYAQVSSTTASLTERDGFTSSGLGSGSFSSGGTVSIVLDATDASAANWTLDLLVNGSAVASDLSTSTVNLGNIDYISIHDRNDSAVANGNVTIDDFTLRIVPDLQITGLSPADDAINVAVDANLVATFDKNVKAGASGNIELWKVGGVAPVETFDVTSSTRLTFSGTDLTIDPTSDLEPAVGTDPSVGYYVLIDADALVSDDVDEDPFPGISNSTAWNFVTDGAPQLASLSPADDATGVSPLLSSLVITFDEAVAAGTGNIELWKDGGVSAEQTFDVTTDAVFNGSEVTVTLGSGLDAATGYHVKIDSGAIVDVSAGNPFAGIADTTSWSFTTGSGIPAILADINADGTNRTASTADFEDAIGLAAGTFSSDSVTVFGGTEEGGAYSETVDNVTLAMTDKSGGADGWFGAGVNNNLLDDGFFYTVADTERITISGSGLGLAANRQYELYLFAGRSADAGGHNTTFTFDPSDPADPTSGTPLVAGEPTLSPLDETLGTVKFTFSTGASAPASLGVDWTSGGSGDEASSFAGFALRDIGAAGPVTYTVTYDGNGNDGGSVPVDGNSPYAPGATVTVLDNTGGLTLTGSTFDGWNTQADGLGTAYVASDTFTINANTTLYAQWTPSGTPYDTWSGGELFDDDKNGDGVSNGLAFLLGADDPDADALGLLPVVTENAGGLVLSFTMRDAASRGNATLDVQWSHDLGVTDLWSGNVAAVPAPPGGTVNEVVFTITENAGDNTLDDVVATIPASKASGGKLFGRLQGVEN